MARLFILRPFALLLALGCVGTIAAEPPDDRIAAEPPVDGISEAVKTELKLDQAVPGRQIEVRAEDGIVTLAGQVDNLIAKRRAARIATTVRGVKSVVNTIRVEPAELRTPRGIEKDLMAAIAEAPVGQTYAVTAAVDGDGKVVLEGAVGSWKEKQYVENIAAGISGVTAVENRLNIRYREPRLDKQIAGDVRAALRWDAMVDGELIEVEVSDGVVQLSGKVGSAAEKERAVNDSWTAGVNRVDASGLEVVPWRRDENLRKKKYASVSDKAVEAVVEKAISMDPRIPASVDAVVEAGRVTLRGDVPTLEGRQAATNIARNTVGVKAVRNRLDVVPAERLDPDAIREQVRTVLNRDPYLQDYRFDIDVVGNTVYLAGQVRNFFERERAERILATVKGVDEIRTEIEITDESGARYYQPYVDEFAPFDYGWYDAIPDPTGKSDEEIREDIRRQMIWSPFVDAGQVEVEIHNGTARLTGSVSSRNEADAAVENAYEGGAVRVWNDLDVE